MSSIDTEDILGYPVTTASMCACLDAIVRDIQNGERGRTVACLNPHSYVMARSDPVFAEALRNSDWLVPDGVGIVLASRMLGGVIRGRITGSDVFRGVMERLNRAGTGSVFFLGATPETLGRIRTRLAMDYPSIRIAGVYAPPFKPVFDEVDTQAMLAAVNSARPDVLWVGMTAPRQEKWIHGNRDRIDAGFIAAVGAVFDFYAGNVRRNETSWFVRHGMEWLPRLAQQPRRLWRRMFVSAPVFLNAVMMETVKRKIFRERNCGC